MAKSIVVTIQSTVVDYKLKQMGVKISGKLRGQLEEDIKRDMYAAAKGVIIKRIRDIQTVAELSGTVEKERLLNEVKEESDGTNLT